MNQSIKELVVEKEKYDKNLENLTLRGKELDSIAKQILETFLRSEATELEAEAVSGLQWALKRLGVA